MYRMVSYGIVAALIGLIAGVFVAGTLFPADASGNTSPIALPALVVVTLIFLGIGLWFAHFLNSRDSAPNQVIDARPRPRYHVVAGCVYGSMIIVELLGGFAIGLFDISILSNNLSFLLAEFVLGILGAIIGIGYAKLRGYTNNMGPTRNIALYACSSYAIFTVVINWQTYFEYPVTFLALFIYLIPIFFIIWFGLSMVQGSNTASTL